MTQAATLFTTSLFANPALLGWRELLYPVVLFLDEWLPFPEACTGEVLTGEISGTPYFPVPPTDKVPPGSVTGTLDVPNDNIDQMIQSVLSQLPSGEGLAEVGSVLLIDSPSQFPASPSTPPAPSKVPDQGQKTDLHSGSSKDAPASASKTAVQTSAPASETATKTSSFPLGPLITCSRLTFSRMLLSNKF